MEEARIQGTEEYQSIIVLTISSSKLGFAWYNELSNRILVDTIPITMDDMDDIITAIKHDCKPSLFLLHSKIVSNKMMLDMIISKPKMINDDIDDDIHDHMTSYMIPKASSLRADTALEMICTKLLIKDCMSALGSYYENYHVISSKIPLDDILIQQVIGALLHHIQTNILSLDDDNITIASIGVYQRQNYMIIDDNTLRSLQIFHCDTHPNLLKGHQHSKEGFSLFSLLDRTQSLAGRQKLRDWMSKPLYDIASIQQRLDVIDTLLNPINREFQSEAKKLLHHMHDILKLLLRIKKVEATAAEWCRLHSSLEQGSHLLRLCISFIHDNDKHDHDRDIINSLIHYLDLEAIISVLRHLNRAINFKATADDGQLCIRDGYDETLDQLRNTFDSLEHVLANAAKSILEQVPLIPSINVEYFPQIGYLVAIRDDNNYLQQLLNDSTEAHVAQQFIFVYKNSDTCYFKHPIVHALDENIGDVVSDIKDRQRALVVAVEEMLLDAEEPLQNLSIAFATLDAYISLSTIASEMRFVRPEVVEANLIVIKNGRHPLQELTVDTFIMNDTFINQDKNIALITGPNNSGKSVYVKQVGIIVYLAHVGSYVPCERAIIGLTDRIMTRISSVETVASPLSSFSADLTQVSKMISTATNRSLCLLDEFGKGTTPIDGISILAATLHYFIDVNAKTLCALHFTEVLHDNILSSDLTHKINTFRMDVHRSNPISADDEDSEECDSELIPLYKLCLGIAPSSEGISCAHAAGIHDDIIARAKYIKNAVTNKTAIKPLAFTDHLYTKQNVELLEILLSYDDWSDVINTPDAALQALKMRLW